MKPSLLFAIAFLTLAAVPARLHGWGGSHSGSFSASDGSWSHSGSTTWTGRYGNTYSTSHSGSGSYGDGWHTGSGTYSNSMGGSGSWNHSGGGGYGYHYGATSVNGTGAYGGSYHYGGVNYGGCYGGGLHAGYVSTPSGGASAAVFAGPCARAGFYRRW